MLDQFYSTVAQASFTLLALYWVLLQLRHDEWFGDARYRRSAYDVSFYFLLPGMMSLLSLLAVQQPDVWRWSFVVLGLVGVAESVLVMLRRGRLEAGGRILQVGDVLSIVLYSLVVLVAVWNRLPRELGLDLRPLEVEGILISALLGLGVVLAAAMFVSTGPHVARTDQA
jgi:hypothetical protein